MTITSQEHFDVILGITSIAIDEEILFHNRSQRIFSKYFVKADSIKYLDNYIIHNTELDNSRALRRVLEKTNLYLGYKNSPFKFIPQCENHFLEIKNYLLAEETNSEINIMEIHHPLDLVAVDTRKLLKESKSKYLSIKGTDDINPLHVLEAYSLVIGLFLSSEQNSPKQARMIHDYFKSFGLSSEDMQKQMESAELSYNIIPTDVLNTLSALEKKNIILMALQMAAIDQVSLSKSEVAIMAKYKEKFFSHNSETKLFEHFLYLSEINYFKHYEKFSTKKQIDVLAFYLTCLKIDNKSEIAENDKFFKLLRKFSFNMTPEVKSQLFEKSYEFLKSPDIFKNSLDQFEIPERFFALINCIDILSSDGEIAKEEATVLKIMMDSALSNEASSHEINLCCMIYLNYLVNNYDSVGNIPQMETIEKYLLSNIEDDFNLLNMIHLVLFNSDFTKTITPLMLNKLHEFFSHKGETSSSLKMAREFEKSFPKEADEIRKKDRLLFSAEVFLRLAIQPEKCIELESFKDSLVNLTAAHVNLTMAHAEFNNQLKKIINNLIFELKIKSSSLEVRNKAIEIACELAISDNNITEKEHDLLNQYTQKLFLKENESLKLTTRILTYSDFPILIHDYLDYKEYKNNRKA